MLKLGIVKCLVNTELSNSYTFPFQCKGRGQEEDLKKQESKGKDRRDRGSERKEKLNSSSQGIRRERGN